MKNYFLSIVTLIFLSGCSSSEDMEALEANSLKLQNETVVDNKLSNRVEDVQVSSFSEDLTTIYNNSSIAYYPPKSNKKLPVAIIMHGWLGSKEKMAWVGELLAKNGFASIVVTAANYKNFFTNPRDWVENYRKAFNSVLEENERKESPLFNRLDTSKISIVAHSMGGGGAFFFADKNEVNIKSIVGLAPYCLEFVKPGAKTTVPSMVIAGGRDLLATRHMTKHIFETLGSDSNSKEYVFYDKVGHNDFEKGGNYHDEIGSNIVRWLNQHGK